MAALLGEEAREKLGGEVTIDTMRPMQAFDAGGRARAMATIVVAMPRAKAAGLAPGALGAALRLVAWSAEGCLLTRATLTLRRPQTHGHPIPNGTRRVPVARTPVSKS